MVVKNKFMRWVCVALLAALFSPAQAGSSAPQSQGQYADTLYVASTTQMSGHFFTDMWGNNTADLDVRALIHGHSTVAWDGVGNYQYDPIVVEDVKVSDPGNGDHTYLFTLRQGLMYSDGTPITAKDYVFSALLISDPRMTSLGAVPGAFEQLAGFEQYTKDVETAVENQAQGKQDEIAVPFPGIRLISDYQFSLTVNRSFLPYFYELSLVNVQPYPIHVIAPGCTVQDDGQGAYIAGPFNREMLMATVLDPENGYLYHPSVSSGSYVLVSFDRNVHEASFARNLNYRGNFEGRTPTIENIVYSFVSQPDALSALESGQIDLVNKVIGGNTILNGLDLVQRGILSEKHYLRTGLAYLGFACEQGVTSSANVRKAVALCVDTEALCEEYLMGYGAPVHGYYGIGQWMVEALEQELARLAVGSIDLNAAKALLINDGWNLGADGSGYDEGVGGVRYRRNQEGELEELVLRWAKPLESDATVQLGDMLRENLTSIGMRLEEAEIPFQELLKRYYRQLDRTYDMFFIANNFELAYDPYNAVHVDDTYQGVFNTTGIRDKELMQFAEDMRKTEPDDQDGYLRRFLVFQQKWVDVLPSVPLYSNTYFDFFSTDLKGYSPDANWSWANAILYATLER